MPSYLQHGDVYSFEKTKNPHTNYCNADGEDEDSEGDEDCLLSFDNLQPLVNLSS